MKPLQSAVLIAVLALLAFGCTFKHEFARTDARQYKVDDYECEYAARLATPMSGYLQSGARAGLWNKCMESRGYTRVKED